MTLQAALLKAGFSEQHIHSMQSFEACAYVALCYPHLAKQNDAQKTYVSVRRQKR